MSKLQQQQDEQSEKFKKALNELIPELNTQIDTLNKSAVDAKYFDLKNNHPDNIQELLADLDEKVALYKQFEDTSNRYNDWQNKLNVN